MNSEESVYFQLPILTLCNEQPIRCFDRDEVDEKIKKIPKPTGEIVYYDYFYNSNNKDRITGNIVLSVIRKTL